MNEYTDAIYNYILDECSQVLTTTEYRMAERFYAKEEEALLKTLTPEQKKLFDRCKERESELESISSRFLFQKTLCFLRGLLCC